MNKWTVFLSIFIICEVAILFFFLIIKKINHSIKIDTISIGKGIIERIFLVIALSSGYTQALPFFGALKLATRLSHDEKISNRDAFNNYYLLGNLLSVAVAIGYSNLFLNFEKISFLTSLLK